MSVHDEGYSMKLVVCTKFDIYDLIIEEFFFFYIINV